ncbi:MAG: hypothetical protein A3C71_02640 [Candidatus Yanofskybacteria bacterium RIFCSPHIGHO2_02_FULL_43_15c]|uniref:EfeO-type cupredoxin-like domain-containing protein n=1 Tax=Candidatus Yanofskybacteria bacterium RIFCSPHIGHO2_02_FULL_43_15c TaxID=1802679 RepID=A0A1F8FKF0_9BACT|nr:MAG: hypothetical protein A3C71_02640 [Candidatus Yanofskybacteria bacterium RIFCSPHIGHO2_02_FULL_43_15c]
MSLNFKEKLRDRSDQAEFHGLPWILIVLLLVLLSTAILYFGKNANSQLATGNQPSTAKLRPARIYSVFYSGGVFSPTNLRIHAGDTVKFQNNGFTAIKISPNTAKDQESGIGFENIGEIQPKNSFSYTFSTVGIFNYHNEKDPNEAGAIIIR